MNLHDYNRIGYFSQTGAHRNQRDSLAFMHWFLIVLACGGAFVGSGEYGPCMKCEP